MGATTEIFVPVRPTVKTLNDIECKCDLGNGDYITIGYCLVYGTNANAKSACGKNTSTDRVESRFEPIDDANVRLTVTNNTNYNLCHVEISDMKLIYTDGQRADEDTLPNGDYVLEIQPKQAYFATIASGEAATRYLVLRSRGRQEGSYFMDFKFKYDLQGLSQPVQLCFVVCEE